MSASRYDKHIRHSLLLEPRQYARIDTVLKHYGFWNLRVEYEHYSNEPPLIIFKFTCKDSEEDYWWARHISKDDVSLEEGVGTILPHSVEYLLVAAIRRCADKIRADKIRDSANGVISGLRKYVNEVMDSVIGDILEQQRLEEAAENDR